MTWEDIIKEDNLEKNEDTFGGAPLSYEAGITNPELVLGLLMAEMALIGLSFYLRDEDFRNGAKGAVKKLLATVAKAPKDIRDKIKQAMKKAE